MEVPTIYTVSSKAELAKRTLEYLVAKEVFPESGNNGIHIHFIYCSQTRVDLWVTTSRMWITNLVTGKRLASMTL